MNKLSGEIQCSSSMTIIGKYNHFTQPLISSEQLPGNIEISWRPLSSDWPAIDLDTLYVMPEDPPKYSTEAFLDRVNSASGRKGKTVSLLLTDRDLLPRLDLRLDSQVYICEKELNADGTEMVAIMEVYAVKNGRRQFNQIGSWLIGKRLFVPANSLTVWERRNDLMGEVLINVLLPYPPLILNDLERGFAFDIIHAIANSVNFSMENVVPLDKQWGAKLDKQGLNYTGIIGMLTRKEADLSISGIYPSVERDRVVDFTLGINFDIMTVHMLKQNELKVNFDVYFSALHVVSWFSLICFSTLIAACLFIDSEVGCSQLPKYKEREKLNFLESLALTGVLTLQRSFPIFLDSLSTRTTYFTACVFTFFVYSGYTALMTSSMIVRSSAVSIRTFEELLSKEYQVATSFNSMPYDMFKNSPKDTPKGKIYQNLLSHQELGYFTFDEAVELMSRNPKVVAYDSALPFLASNNIQQVKDFRGSLFPSNSFCLQKDSEFLGLFDHEILKLLQNGVHDKLLRKWGISAWRNNGASSSGDSNLDSGGLSYRNVIFPFLILCGGIAGSTILLLAELFKKFRDLEKPPIIPRQDKSGKNTDN